MAFREGTAVDKGQIGRHTAVVLLANSASMALGLLATVLVARYFGSGATVDAFFVALAVPQVVGQILLSVALISIVPVYLELKTKSGADAAQASVAPLFYFSAVVLSILALILMIAAPWAIRILAPGFGPAAHGKAVELLRWLSPLIPLLGLSGFLQGIENANEQFARAAWAKPLLSGTAVGGLLLLASGYGIRAYAWGMLVGAILGFAWQMQEVWAVGNLRPRLQGWRRELKHYRAAFGAILTARFLGQAGVLITSMVASTLMVGTVSALGYALKVASVPFLASASFGIVLFPALAQAKADADDARQVRLLWRSVRAMTVLGLAVAIPLFVWAEPIIQLLFERGAFSPNATALAASALRVYALGIAFVAANTNIGNAFWAQGWYRVRLVLETTALVLLVVLSLALGRLWGAPGLAGALVVEFVFLTAAGLYLAQMRMPETNLGRHYRVLGKLLIIAVFVAAVAWPLTPAIETFRSWSLAVRLLAVAVATIATLSAFALLGFLFAVPEIDEVVSLVVRRFTRRGRELDADQLNLLPRRMRARLGHLVLNRLPRRKRKPTRSADLAKIVTSVGTRDSLANEFRSGPRLPGSFDIGLDSPFAPDLELAVERALKREVDVLGSGTVSLGRPINWHKDYVSGYVWPAVYHGRVRAVQREGGIDCKFPWEIARCQHWPWLAAAQTRSDRAIDELLRQFEEFVAANPPGTGITYGNAMETGIRAVNWLCAFRRAADLVDGRKLEHLAVEMHEAGTFIRKHLEATERGLNSNHYIADLVGLYTIATLFPSLPNAPEWYRFAGNELGAELPYQFDADGLHREGAPAYARLVIEFYLFAYRLGRDATDPRVEAWSERLEAAIDALATLMLPDGTLPRLGDDDSGRLLTPPGEGVDDVRYLLQIGAVTFERADWKGQAGATPRPGLAFWLGPEAVRRYAMMPKLPRRAVTKIFVPGGVAIQRTAQTALVLQGGRTERRGPRGHLHNDLTSLEYFADGVRWLIDPGTYQYTRQPVWRNRFRSTGAHNVVQVDEIEQNRWRNDWLFYLSRDAEPQPLQGDAHQFTAGYAMPAAAVYRGATRTLELSSDGRAVRVEDRVEGTGSYPVTLRLNIARSPFTYLKNDLLLFRGRDGDFLLHVPMPGGFLGAVKDGWYSPRFGVRERCFRFESSGTATLPLSLSWGFAAVPKGEDVFDWARRLGCDMDSERPEVRR